jgi:predicted RNA-binding protein with PIN domain
MRLLIDGYNLMFALGLMGGKFGPDGFRKVRLRFLNDLAAALGPVEAHQTTIVFDAADPPFHVPHELTHKGLTVLFAVDEESADDRIESLIAHHSAPKTLTVVSSDHRLREAASRRKARAVTADDFCTELEDRRRRKPAEAPEPPSAEERARLHGLTPEEADFWLAAFADLAAEPETRAALRGDLPALTDDDIARIQREVEEEGEFGSGPRA